MRFHLPGLPHTNTTAAYMWCAYSQKILKYADMMVARGHEVYLYGGPDDDSHATEHIVCADELPPNGEIPEFSADSELFATFNDRASAAISERIEPHDFICLIAGLAQAPIAAAFPNHQAVEYGIGYGGVIPSTHHVYESYAWMHTVLGAQTGGDPHRADGRFFDAVVPNYFNVTDFPPGKGDGGYLLYLGRLIERKGVQIALETAERAQMPLKVAGAGDFPLPSWVDYRGVVGPRERAELMGSATAVLAPTTYVEPFGGVAVEAQLCGTPAITTDWGAFPETVRHGVSGFRCHTLREFVNAAHEAPSLNRKRIRRQARARYSLDAVGERYEGYFARLLTLWEDGFYQGR